MVNRLICIYTHYINNQQLPFYATYSTLHSHVRRNAHFVKCSFVIFVNLTYCSVFNCIEIAIVCRSD